MTSRALRPHAQVCQLCDFLSTRQISTSRPLQPGRFNPRHGRQTKSQCSSSQQLTFTSFMKSKHRNIQSKPLSPQLRHATTSVSDVPESSPQTKAALLQAKAVCDRILQTTSIPKERDILMALAHCEIVAEQLVDQHGLPSKGKNGSAASALLEVEKPSAAKTNLGSTDVPSAVEKTIDQLSGLAHSVMTHPSVFITPKALERYVNIQANLQRPETLPEIFHLFAYKPIPEEGSAPIKFVPSRPHRAASAVPAFVADRALQIAIDTKQMGVAMNVVGESYATQAFRKAKFIRQALLPVTGLAAAPIAIYTVAAKFGLYQTSMDPQMATNMAFVGILAYLGFTTTIGVVVVTTANDQMDRVTWATGMPLKERWLREEERAAIDRIAGAWGFQQPWRRGEEEGQDWAELREWIGMKGMVLDRSELMEGME